MSDRPRSPSKWENLWNGTTLQWLGVILFPLGMLVLIVAVVSSWLHQRGMRQMVGERDEMVVRASAAMLDYEIYRRTVEISRLGRELEYQPLDELMDNFSYSQEFDAGVAQFNRDGELIGEAVNGEFWREMTENRFFFSAITHDEGQLFDLRQGDAYILFYKTILPHQNIVLVGAATLSTIAAPVFEKILPMKEETRVFIVDDKNQILYTNMNGKASSTLVSQPAIADALAGRSGTSYFTYSGLEYVASYAPLERLGWAIIMEEPWEAVANPVIEITQIAPLVLVPLLIIALGALWFGARQIVRPLSELELKSAQMAQGDIAALEESVGGIAEIRHLQGELVRMARNVQSAQRSLKEYIGAITSAQEDERRRLARELHDSTLQSVIALKQRVQIAQRQVSDRKNLQVLRELESIADQTIEELRNTTRALRPIYLEDLGLVASLKMLANEFERNTGIPVSFSQKGEERRLGGDVELALYRISQEALRNVSRHAQASSVRMSIDFSTPDVELSVEDDGIGFIPPESLSEFVSQGHFGLLGMRERAELVGASLEISSRMGQGTFVNVRVRQ